MREMIDWIGRRRRGLRSREWFGGGGGLHTKGLGI